MAAFSFHSLPTCKIYISMIARLATSHLWENRDLPLVLVEITAAHEGSLTMRRATVKMVRDFILEKFVKGCPTVCDTDRDYSQIQPLSHERATLKNDDQFWILRMFRLCFDKDMDGERLFPFV